MRLMDIYERMLEILGHQHWWPADTPFEVVVGALLTQQTRWNNVECAIENLKAHKLLDPGRLASADQEELETLIRCTGFYRQKARRLKQLARYFSIHQADLAERSMDTLRRELLELDGVGEETADSIMLYALNKPRFVIDAYTRRILGCFGISGNYSQLQKMFEDEISPDIGLYKEYHALIVEWGKQYCGTSRCKECVLVDYGKTLI